MKLSMKFGLAAWASLISAAGLSQQSVKWDAARTALAGSGCIKDVDTFVLENGNDLSVVFSALGVNLPGNASSTLAGRSTCTVRVPVRVAPGVYIGELTQRVSFGVTKTARTRGSLATRSTFFNFGVSPYTVNLPYGQSINDPLLVNSRRDLFSVRTTPSWYQGFCAANRAPQGLYMANFAVSGQKDRASEDLIMFVDGLDLRYEVVAGPVQCQL